MDTALSSDAKQPQQVVVLMSTFNGERFVSEQVRSILEQLPADGQLLVRDDGSSDGTVATIRRFGDHRVRITQGSNLGFAASFLTLLMQVPEASQLVLISDQDDVWMPGKLDRAWQMLAPLGATPALYGGAKQLVDDRLQTLGVSPSWPRQPSFQNALVENIITGCTAALNHAAVMLLQRAGIAKGVHFHDWWLYLVVSAHGRVVYDEQAFLLYRQHGSNQIGQGAGFWSRQAGMLQFLWRRDWAGMLLMQIAALMRHYGESLSADQRRLVLEHFEIRGYEAVPRRRLLLGLMRWRQYLLHEPALRLLLLARRFKLWPISAKRL